MANNKRNSPQKRNILFFSEGERSLEGVFRSVLKAMFMSEKEKMQLFYITI
jgi:hypothetical protein